MSCNFFIIPFPNIISIFNGKNKEQFEKEKQQLIDQIIAEGKEVKKQIDQVQKDIRDVAEVILSYESVTHKLQKYALKYVIFVLHFYSIIS